MKPLRILLPFIVCLACLFEGVAQTKKTRIQPGKIYNAGETLYAPRVGFTATVPPAWEGMLPRESEVFLLTPTGSVFGEIYVYVVESMDINTLKAVWVKGTDLSETIRLKAINPTIEGDMLYAEGVGEGEYINKGNRAFGVARCNANGTCVVALGVMPVQFYEPVKKTLLDFMKASTFGPPSTASPYADLNWEELLAGKSVITYVYAAGGSKDTEIHLCADGSFSAVIKKSGFMKNQNPDYRGKLSGTWNVDGVGESTKLKFTFTGKKALSPVEVVLTIKEDKIFADGERYSIGKSLKCK